MYRPHKNEQIFYEGDWPISPMQVLEALDDAKDEMDYSNYHNDKFDRAKEVIIRWCTDQNIKLGKTRKQWEALSELNRKKKNQAILNKIKKIIGEEQFNKEFLSS